MGGEASGRLAARFLFPAHIRYLGTEKADIQTVQEHCRATARYAREAAPEALANTAYLCGLLHDFGKFKSEFGEYLERASRGEAVRRGSVNHTFAAARYVMERWHKNGESLENLTAETVAYATGSHHGMFDCIAPDGTDGFQHRVKAEEIGYAEARNNFLAQCADEKELDGLFSKACEEIKAVSAELAPLAGNDENQMFYFSLAARMLLSAVVEGDRRDTAEFMGGKQLPRHQSAAFSDCLENVMLRLDKLPKMREIDKTRREISDICCKAAVKSGGIHTLSVPTGGGKTLCTVRYALAFAVEHNMDRVIFTIPLLSVLEQNAKVIREYIGNDSMVLEHHSNLVIEKCDGKELDENELLTERWDAPVIITTLVQLLNTLFDGRMSCVRRMNALKKSVIVIDEVQSVPTKLISQFNMALNFLTSVCGANIVLCSATQPCFEKTEHPLLLSDPPELVTLNSEQRRVFRRTEIIDRRSRPGYDARELAEFASKCADEYGSALVICNKRSQARDVFAQLGSEAGTSAFHLSTSMCMAHRILTLDGINAALAGKNQKTLCISTQLVEAGVDFSFGCVIRVIAGLDNIVQAAGRCNRSGDAGGPRPVYIVNYRGEDLRRLEDIRAAQNACEGLLTAYRRNPAGFGDDLAGDAAVQTYYSNFFGSMPKRAFDYPLPDLGVSMFELLGSNDSARVRCVGNENYLLGQAFRSAGERFSVFDNRQTDVPVPFGEGKNIIAELRGRRAQFDFEYRGELLKKCKAFSIALYSHEITPQNTEELFDGAVKVLNDGYYSEKTGFCAGGTQLQFLEVQNGTQEHG